MAGLELAEREDDTVAVSVAVVDEVLDGLDDVDAHLDRADAQGRLGTMAAAAVECDGEVVAGGRDFAAADADITFRQAAGDVQAQGVVDAGIVEDAGVDHAGCAAIAFFGRLEGQAYRAAQAVFMLVEDFGDAQQVGGMAVMAAGVHDAVDEG